MGIDVCYKPTRIAIIDADLLFSNLNKFRLNSISTQYHFRTYKKVGTLATMFVYDCDCSIPILNNSQYNVSQEEPDTLKTFFRRSERIWMISSNFLE